MHRSVLSLASRGLLLVALSLAAAPAAGQGLSLSGAAWYPVGLTPYDLALGDFDGDGILDAATVDIEADSLTVRRGDGIGGFGPPLTVPVGDGPWKVVAGRLNADLFDDLVVCHHNADGTWILLADGLGGFATPVPFDAGLISVAALVDLDLDGDLDLALTTRFTSTVRAFLGDGEGGFGAQTGSWTLPGGTHPLRLRPLFLDADIWPDLIVFDSGGDLHGLFGTGSGTFSSVKVYTNYGSGFDVAVAALNADSFADLALTRTNSGQLVILFNDGTGELTGSGQSLGVLPWSIAAGDWNGDGFTDLAVTADNQTQRTLLGDGAGNFAVAPAAQWPPVNCLGRSLLAADVDLDGDPDLLCADESGSRVVVSLGDGAGAFTAGRTFPAGAQPRALSVAPFDAVPGSDLLVGSYAAGGGFRLLPNLGGGLFGPPAPFTPAGVEVILGAAAGDLDGDGDQDAAFATWPSVPRVGVALGDGAGDFPDASTLDSTTIPWAVGLGDFDSDAQLDLAIHGRLGVNGVALLAGDGEGGFDAPEFYGAAGANSTVGFALADLDGDGDLDVAHPNAEAQSFTVRLGDGAGGLGSAATHGVTGACNDVAAGDLDGDLDLDLVASGLRLSVFLQEPAGIFAPQQVVVPDFLLHQAALADFDGDGDLDVAVVGDQNGILAYANDGLGTLSGPTRFGSWGKADNLRTEDLDGDGLPDLVATLFGTDRVIVLRNNARRLADLAVAVDDGRSSAVPGEPASYQVTVTNSGPALVNELTLAVVDTPPLVDAAIAASAGSYTPATGVWSGLELRHGESATLTLDATVDPWATGTQVVAATVTAPAGVSDPVAGNDAAADEDALTPRTGLELAKSDGETAAIAGLPVTYALTVTNHGPSAAAELELIDPLPAALLSPLFTPERGSYDSATGAWTGALLGPGESVTLTLAATVDAAAAGDLLVNGATVAPPAGAVDPQPLDDAATDVDALLRVADLALAIDDGRTGVAPGETLAYTLTLVNHGPSLIGEVALVVTLSPPLLGVGYTPATGAFDAATGAWSGLALAPGQSTTMVLTGAVDLDATGALVGSAVVFGSAGVSDPAVANNIAHDQDFLAPAVDLVVTKSDGRTHVLPGETLVYAISVANPGPSHAPGTLVTDLFPSATLADCSWTCAPSGGAVCPAGPVVGDLDTLVDLPAGGAVEFSATCTATAAVATETVVNAATAMPPLGITELDSADNGASDLTGPALIFGDGFESGDCGAWSYES